jgi:hypothetical protein
VASDRERGRHQQAMAAQRVRGCLRGRTGAVTEIPLRSLIALIFGSDHDQSTGQPVEWRDGGGGAADKGDGTHDIESRWVSQPPVSAGDCDHGDSITSRFGKHEVGRSRRVVEPRGQ